MISISYQVEKRTIGEQSRTFWEPHPFSFPNFRLFSVHPHLQTLRKRVVPWDAKSVNENRFNGIDTIDNVKNDIFGGLTDDDGHQYLILVLDKFYPTLQWQTSY